MLRRVAAMAVMVACLAMAGSCPFSIRCSYHNQIAYKQETTWSNGKQFGVYEHTYVDDRGKDRTCKLLVECER